MVADDLDMGDYGREAIPREPEGRAGDVRAEGRRFGESLIVGTGIAIA